MYVEAELGQGFAWISDLGVSMSGVVRTVEDVRVGRRQMLAVVAADDFEERRGTGVLASVEMCGSEEVTQAQVQERVVSGACDTVLEEPDGLRGVIVVQQYPNVGLQLFGLGVGELSSIGGLLPLLGRGQEGAAEGARRVSALVAARRRIVRS